MPDEVALNKLIALVTDLTKEVSKCIRTNNAVLDRYTRAAEEQESVRLALKEIRELLADHFEENALWADNLSGRMDRQERYVILTKMGIVNNETVEISSEISQEHIKRALRENLVTQRELWSRYQKNIDRVKDRIANFGETVSSLNEVEGYEKKLSDIEKAIERIQEKLTVLEQSK